MSRFSAWSYTATATFWQPTGFDEYSEPTGWDRVEFACGYVSGGRETLDSTGQEFVPGWRIWLEAAAADAPRPGWRVVIGSDASATPPTSAQTVRRVDTFDPSAFSEGLADHSVAAA